MLGGILGYAIGALLYDSIGHWLIEFYGYGGKVEAFRASYAEWGAWIILGKGLTPIPYKLVTITSGFAGYNIWLFIVAARSSRAAAASSWSRSCSTATANGSGSRIEKHLGLWVALGAAVLVLGFVIAFRMF